jgi:CPW-WPC domain-containing protein
MTRLLSFLLFGVARPACGAFLRASDDSGPVGDVISKTMADMQIAMAPDTSKFEDASELIRGMALVPGPPLGMASRSFLDPRVDADPASCDRDYSVACPASFVNVGPIKGGDEEYCAASPEYDGPCNAEGYRLTKMSRKARERWSATCQANWPCKVCERDFTEVCPEGWSNVAGTMECKPPTDYDGPCKGGSDFAEYNVAMLKRWSAACRAYWKCK